MASPAAKYDMSQGVKRVDFKQYGERLFNHEVMMGCTLGNFRLSNLMAACTEGGVRVRHLRAMQGFREVMGRELMGEEP